MSNHGKLVLLATCSLQGVLSSAVLSREEDDMPRKQRSRLLLESTPGNSSLYHSPSLRHSFEPYDDSFRASLLGSEHDSDESTELPDSQQTEAFFRNPSVSSEEPSFDLLDDTRNHEVKSHHQGNSLAQTGISSERNWFSDVADIVQTSHFGRRVRDLGVQVGRKAEDWHRGAGDFFFPTAEQKRLGQELEEFQDFTVNLNETEQDKVYFWQLSASTTRKSSEFFCL